MVLNWERSSNRNLQVRAVDIDERSDLLRPIMKSPGPFYQSVDGSFLSDCGPFDQQKYLDQLAGVPVYEANGCVDFQWLSEHCLKILHS